MGDPRTELSTLGWDEASRARLAAMRKQGVVAVHYSIEDCHVKFELLSRCFAAVKYAYAPYWSAKPSTTLARDAQELAAQLPLLAKGFDGTWRGNRVVRLDSTSVGVATIPFELQLDADVLRGPECSRATHVVRRIHLGGFAMTVGTTRAIEARNGFYSAVAPASQVETLAREGEPAGCEQAALQGHEDPDCAVPLRVSIAPIERAPAQVGHGCPADSFWDGKRCAGAMVKVPAGAYEMGDHDLFASVPVHRVTLNSFEIDRTEVTVSEYRVCLDTGGCKPDEKWHSDGCNLGKSGREQHPMNCVDWHQANAYCAWAGKRLPTEQEWEYAARGTDGRKYPWGSAPPRGQLCWSGVGNAGNPQGATPRTSTCEVGSFPSGDGPFGAADMAGNVYEWVADLWCYNYKANVPCDASIHTARGGGWTEERPRAVLATDRTWGNWFEGEGRSTNVGFRCVRAL